MRTPLDRRALQAPPPATSPGTFGLAALLRALVAAAEGWCRVVALALTATLMLCGTASAQHFTFARYGASEGLSNLAVRVLLQDQTGFIWVGTENGLFRFDGRHFERMTPAQGLHDPNIRSLALDAQDRLWIGTPSDLYLRSGDSFTAVRPGGKALLLTRPGQQIQPVGPDEALLIVQEQLVRISRLSAQAPWTAAPYFSAEQLAAEPGLAKLSALLREADGSLWLGCGQRLCQLRDGQLHAWDAGMGVAPTLWRTLMRDRSGRLWARGVSSVAVLEPGARRFTPRDPPEGLLGSIDNYAPLIEDAQGRILTRTNVGVARWDGTAWQAFDRGNGLVAASTTALLADRDGAVWQGNFGRGVARWLGYGQWEGWTAAQGLEQEAVWNIGRSAGGDLLVHTNGGCMRLPQHATRLIDCAIDGLPPGQITTSAIASDGTHYVSVRNRGVYRVDASRKARLIATLPRFTRLMLDRDGRRLWAATSEGPYLLTPPADGDLAGAWTATNPSGDSGSVGTMAIGGDGRIWFAADQGLSVRHTDGRWSSIRVTDPNGHAGVDILAVAPDGAVWVGTPAGIARLQIDGGRVRRSEWMDTPLAREFSPMFLRFDRRGWLWVGTDVGLVLFDGQVWRRLDSSDGLIWSDTDLDAFFEDDDGSLWFGTSGGLAHLRQPALAVHSPALTARIVTARYGERALAQTSPPLPWVADAALDVRVAALSPAQAQGTRFRYRIVGLSHEWFETANAEIHTPSLQPGSYQLEVVAFKPNAAITSPPVVLSFDVLPPWWRNPWLHAAAAAGLALALALAWRHRTQVLKARHTQLEELLDRATRDPLTGLWNRATILDRLDAAIVQARAEHSPLAIAMIDIDHFKAVNDQFGHLGGDAVLHTLGRHLLANVRQGDLLGRYGGEELLLVMPGTKPPPEPLHTVERLRELIEATEIAFTDRVIRVTASLGVEWLDPGDVSAQALIGRADMAMYAAKSGGRNRVAYARPVARASDSPVESSQAA